ncbi:transporter [Robiginitalea sp. IMCC44478]|uniref:transporter n=1 Tax=Robiginitalea sp. IMCC44478 TaxID=3459122 RepID=UPI004041FE43
MAGAPYRMYLNSISGYLLLIIFFTGLSTRAQYTDVINSNRPGKAVSAYAVGKNVIQAEAGLFYEIQDHNLINTESDIFGSDIALRYGLFFETLEIHWEGIFQQQQIDFLNIDLQETYTDFYRNRLGLKFLLFDPFKNPERNKPNLYSWRANNVFQFKNLIPAISVYAGANFNLGDNPFYPDDPIVSPRAMIATQSKLTPRMVLISNVAYDRIGTDFPEWSYLVSLSRALRNPKWSVFIENQGISSDRYSDILLRGGVAHLFSENFQADLLLGGSFKNTPSRLFISSGVSYRLDFHKDDPIPIEDQDRIGRNSMKNQGKAAGMSKKERKKLRKKERKARKKKKNDWEIGS